MKQIAGFIDNENFCGIISVTGLIYFVLLYVTYGPQVAVCCFHVKNCTMY